MKATVEIQGLHQFREEALELLRTIRQELAHLKAEKEIVEYYSVSNVAKRLGVSTAKVRAMFHDGVLDGKQSTGGKKIMISRESLEGYDNSGIPKLPRMKRVS